MKQLRHVLALTLVFCMVFGMVTPSLAVSGEISVEEDNGIPVEEDEGIEIEVDDRSDYDIDSDREELSVLPKQDEAADKNAEGDDDTYKYNIIHLDCGRKYFSVNSIKTIIDNAAKAGFNYIQLAVGNDGMRFLLDDMSLTVNGTTYESEQVANAIHAGNVSYNNQSNVNYSTDKNELTQSEMDTIIAYAYSKGMGVIPLINTPGHMDAILDAAEELTEKTCSYDGSARTIDVTNDTAKAFTEAFLQKYITYFAGKGCKLFNMGADEYANDIYLNYTGMGFGRLQKTGKYGDFIAYVNKIAGNIKTAGMTPMAFNDGIYYGSDTETGEIDKAIIIEYWSSGWGSYSPMPASTLNSMGFKLVNTHGDYYWVLGKSDWQCDATKASGFDATKFQGSDISNPVGSTFCIWCDYPGAGTEASVISSTAATIKAFGAKVAPLVGAGDNGGATDTTGKTVEITLKVGETTTRTINGVAYTGTALNDDYAKVVAADSSVAGETTYAEVTSITTGAKYCISYNGENFLSPKGKNSSSVENVTEDAPEWVVSGNSTDGYTLSTTIDDVTYYLRYGNNSLSVSTYETNATKWSYYNAFYYKSGSSNYYIKYYNGNWITRKNGGVNGLPYIKTTTTAQTKTTVTITGKAPTKDLQNGYTTATVGSGDTAVTYNITVEPLTGTYNLAVKSGGTATLNVPELPTAVGTTMVLYDYDSEYITSVNGNVLTAATVDEDTKTTVTVTVMGGSNNDIVLATYTYNVTITTADLSDTKTVEYWITNRQVTADGDTSKTISAGDAYGEDGAAIADLVPEEGTYNSNRMVYWKGTRLTSDKKQTTDSADDKTTKGNDFTHIRYWNDEWAFSSDGETWTVINETDQIVAYYLQHTDVTEEIETEVVDWGEVPHTNYKDAKYVLLDYTVKYESGERSPSVFTNANTMGFHCNDSTDKDKTVFLDEKENSYYRRLGAVRAKETKNYEVYMITLTPSNDDASEKLASQCNLNGTISYSGTEKVIWVDDVNNLGIYANTDRQYVSPSGLYDFDLNTSVGGTPTVPAIEIYNQQGMLVTYYVRAKVTEDSLTVRYIDDDTKQEFYHYNIAVKQGTYFNDAIKLNTALTTKNQVENGDVENLKGKTQTVSSDISSISEIGSSFRNGNYECVRLEKDVDTNAKEIRLYYTFNNVADFVVDFGVPLHITSAAIGLNDRTWENVSVSGQKHGLATVGNDIGLTYTPTSILTEPEVLFVGFDEKNTATGESVKNSYKINLYPATNVLYEENVIANPAGSDWTTVGKSTIDSTTTQATEKLGNEEKNVHGYDDVYDDEKNTEFSGGSAYVAKLTLPAGERNVRTKDVLSFTFTGTGFDLISECGTNTGALLVNVYRVGGDGSKTLDHGFLVDTYFSGDSKFITGTDILDYQVPVVRDFIKKTVDDELVDDYGTYEVTVKGFLFSHSGAAVNSTNAISTYSTQNIVEETLASLGIPEEDFGLYEVVYMDDNSVLNGGTGAETSVVKSDVATFIADIASNNALELNDATDGAKTAYVYVDGIRVYNTIDPSKQPDYKTSEKNTEYYNVYDFVLNSSAGTSDKWYEMDSAIYIEKDGETSLYDIADYKKQGPENEIYLTSDNAVVFALDGYNPATSTVQVAVKAVSGTPSFNGNSITHATELYYEVSYDGGNGYIKHSDNYGYYIILTNDDGNGKSEEKSVLSISAIKVSSNIKLIANAKLGDEIVKDLNSSTTGFKPDTFTASIPKTVKTNRRFTVTITASDDVAKVIVKDKSSGNVIGAKEQMQAQKSGDTYRYSIIATAPNSTGNYTILVYAENSSGTDSDPIELTITVK